MRESVLCIDCGINRKTKNSHVCTECFDNFITHLKKNYRDVKEEKEESRVDFLLRVSKEFGIQRTKKEIKHLINKGFTDEMILNKKRLAVWRPSYIKRSNVPF